MYLSNRSNILATEESKTIKRKPREFIGSLEISSSRLGTFPTCVWSSFSGKAPCQDQIFPLTSKQLETKENAAEELEVMRHTAFEKACYDLTHSERAMNDRVVGRRVGLYELRGVIGSGNFSQVRFGIHDLTKGKTNTSHFYIIITVNRRKKNNLYNY